MLDRIGGVLGSGDLCLPGGPLLERNYSYDLCPR